MIFSMVSAGNAGIVFFCRNFSGNAGEILTFWGRVIYDEIS
jgi:hypothetical protein